MEATRGAEGLLSSVEFASVSRYIENEESLMCEGEMHIYVTPHQDICLSFESRFRLQLKLCQVTTETGDWEYVIEDTASQTKFKLKVLAGDPDSFIVLHYCLQVHTNWQGPTLKCKLTQWASNAKDFIARSSLLNGIGVASALSRGKEAATSALTTIILNKFRKVPNPSI